MITYAIHRMKEHARQSFRWAAHTAGAAQVKPKDYEASGCVEAPHVYGAWAALRESDRPLEVGDLLEDPAGRLRIFKYVGFEEATWVLPDIQTGLEKMPLATGDGSGPAATAG
jgi:hypothetical protein